MRARAPIFDDVPFTLLGRLTNEAELYAVSARGGMAMQARATLG